MARAASLRAPSQRKTAPYSIEEEIAHLRDLDLSGLRARWQSVTGRVPSKSVPKHILFGMLAYRLQAEAWGDLDAATVQLLDRAARVESNRDILPLQRKQVDSQCRVGKFGEHMAGWSDSIDIDAGYSSSRSSQFVAKREEIGAGPRKRFFGYVLQSQ